ncbi:hypothetical protein Tco_1098204 [Tanacetum coccineum]
MNQPILHPWRVAPPSLDYVPGPEHPPSLDYVHGPDEPEQSPLSPEYVTEPEYLEYLVPSDAEAPIEDQTLPDDASPTALSPGYVADSDLDEDLEEDPEEDPADYPADRGDNDDDESSDDDDDKEEEHEASEDDDEDEEEHSAPADSFAIPVDDPVPSAEVTKAFVTDESAPTLVPSPRRRMARMSVRPQTPMSAATEALIAMVAAALPSSPPPSPLTPLSFLLPHIPSPPLPVPSPPLPLPSSPTLTSPIYDEAPLGYKAARIRLRAVSPPTHHPSKIPSPLLLLPSLSHRDVLPKADMPLRKRAHFTAPTGRFEVRESSAVAAARQHGLDVATVDATDTWDELVETIQEIAPITLVEGLNQRDDRALQRGRVNTLFRDKRYHLRTSVLVQTHETHIQTPDAQIGSLETLVLTLVAQTSSLQTQLTIALGRIQTLEAREPKMPPKRTAVTTTLMTDAQIKALISQGVADALAEIRANRTNRNGDDSHDSGSGARR